MNSVIINNGIIRYILNSINSITWFYELSDNKYWTDKIFLIQNIKLFQYIQPRGSMNIGILRYISNSITRFLEPRDYKYWTYKIYFKLKI